MSLVGLSAALPLGLAVLATTAPGHRLLDDAAARKVATTRHHLRRQPPQRQLLSTLTGHASTYRAAYATSEATSRQ